MVVKGTIVSVDPNSGEVAVIDDAAKTVMLTAGPDFDLKTVQKGDEVTVVLLVPVCLCSSFQATVWFQDQVDGLFRTNFSTPAALMAMRSIDTICYKCLHYRKAFEYWIVYSFNHSLIRIGFKIYVFP